MAAFLFWSAFVLFLFQNCHDTIAENAPRRLQMDSTFNMRKTPEIISGEINWSNGRTFGGNSPLARQVADHPDEYWGRLSGQLMEYAQEKSQEMNEHWQKTVANNSKLRQKVSKECFNVLQHMIQHPIDNEWTAKMIDSMGSLPTGLLSTTLTSLGDFDQCLSIDGAHNGAPFVGKYCLARVNLPRSAYQAITFNGSLLATPPWTRKYLETAHHLDNRFSFASALCFPSLCKQTEITQILQSYYPVLQSFEFNVSICQSRDEPAEVDNRVWLPLTILLFIVFLVLLALLVDIFLPSTSTPSTFHRLLNCFSPISNTRILFRILDSNEETVQFQFAHGIRAISCVIIVVAHVVGVMPSGALPILPYARFLPDYQTIVRRFAFQPLFNGGVIVHLFLILAGMLMTFHNLSIGKMKHSFLAHVGIRWLRTAPALLGMICVSFCLELIGSGPLWHRQVNQTHLDGVYDYWWATVALIHSLVPLEFIASVPTWSLAGEMHLHIIAYLLLLAYTRSSKLTYLLSGVFIALQGVATAYVLLSGWAKPIMFQFAAFAHDSNIFPQCIYSWRVLYLFTFNHIIPYFIGAILGQMLLEKRVFAFSKMTTRLLWIASFAFINFLLFHTYFPIQTPHEEMTYFLPGTLNTALTIYIFTLANSLSIGWIIYQCAVNSQNAVSRFLSAKAFQPLSRLSFSVLLMQMPAILFNDLQTRKLISLAGVHSMFQMISSSLLLSLIFGYLFFLTFDAPIARLIKMMLKRSQKTPVKEILDKNSNVMETLEERKQKKII